VTKMLQAPFVADLIVITALKQKIVGEF